jgi:(2R)-ethylmalonyl-CoA mutase
MQLVPEIVRMLREGGVEAPIVVGGIIPPADAEKLQADGVARVYTPKDFEINRMMGDIVELVAQRNGAGQAATPA